MRCPANQTTHADCMHHEEEEEDHHASLMDYVWWSLITITTIGYVRVITAYSMVLQFESNHARLFFSVAQGVYTSNGYTFIQSIEKVDSCDNQQVDEAHLKTTISQQNQPNRYGNTKIHTTAGKVVGALCAISGVPLFAIPIPILSKHLERVYQRELRRNKLLNLKMKLLAQVRTDVSKIFIL